MKKLISLLLSLLLLASCSNTKISEVKPKDFSIPEYYHYDASTFYSNIDAFKVAIENKDVVSLNNLYDELYKELLTAYDLATICYIKYTEDVTNEYYIDEDQYIEDLANEMSNSFASLCHEAALSDIRDSFKEHINNDDVFNNYIDYVVKTDEILALESEEIKLSKEYDEITSHFGEYSLEKDGVSYSFNDAIEDSYTFYTNHGDFYFDIVNNAYKKFNEDTGDIYIKLVDIRDQIAKYYGYDNYALYADNEIYTRDYTNEDLYYLKEYTKEFSEYFLFKIYTNEYQYEDIDLTPNELINKVLNIISNISFILEDASNVFKNNKLYSIASADTRYNGSYNTSFDSNNASFVFLNTTNTENDYFTLAHEFGHFTNGINVKNYDPVCASGAYDVFEIHSTGLEMLFGLNAKDLFEDNFDLLNSSNLIDKFSNLVDGCLYDDFQRNVYENPGMSLEEINSMFEDLLGEYGYKALADDYGLINYDVVKYMWSSVPHNFNNPMYYVSYATSAFAAIQIYQLGLDDFKKAVSIWEKICLFDPYRDGYHTITSNAGLESFTNEDAVYNTYSAMYDYLEN